MTDCFVTQALVRSVGRENYSRIQITISRKGETKRGFYFYSLADSLRAAAFNNDIVCSN